LCCKHFSFRVTKKRRVDSEKVSEWGYVSKLKFLLRRSLTSVTIMAIPHGKIEPLKIRVPVLALTLSLLLSALGAVYIVSIGVSAAEYYGMKTRVAYYSSELSEVKVMMAPLQKAEPEFKGLLSLGSRRKILEADNVSGSGNLNHESLRDKAREAIQSIPEIKAYIKEQRTASRATPGGWPINGEISSPFGSRKNPVSGEKTAHSGIDIRAAAGTAVKATAPGIVSFSGWRDDSGYVVVLEHGCGFSTVYAHNKANYVKPGQKVGKGETIAVSGSSGAAMGPHLHYEVWKRGRPANPVSFLEGLS
jgi:murein DD-endopeptidase MepM/ murein hydrolase activator NlpD